MGERMLERGTTASLERSEIYTEKLGSKSGTPIIIMHGWGQNLESMRGLGELLSKTHPVYLMDLPGFGRSAEPREDADTIAYAQMLKEFLGSNDLARVHLLGHSFGGRVSIRFASRYPEMVESVVLVNSGGLKRVLDTRSKLKSMRLKLLSRTCKVLDKVSGSNLYKDWFTPKFGSRDYLASQGVMRKVLIRAVNEDVSEDAGRIDCPVFLLWGEKDTETPLEMGERFNSLIKDSKLTVLPGKDHFPFLGDGAHLCAHHILGFLKAFEVRSGG